MNTDELQRIIDAGENLHVEFKRYQFKRGQDRQRFDEDLVETVVSFCNADLDEKVGYILLGVDDDRNLSGADLRQRLENRRPEYFQA